ncbi:ABC transporter permease [Geobacter sp. DSM 9736]|uniref:MlaE family ABC transporter permease n=1 Tax=Geobacter sp. DSM 9736 TaxID=1277350 RepID=UPI000B506C42|nr:ABC transporter permease [Geobacter sp. DSM 9736]SNB47931.1 phospholipid/cholesterol/gamma-HCH transport system permease protein [Geobacter sp. DSM 9736]
MKNNIVENLLKSFFHEIQEFFFLTGRAIARIFQRPFYYREFVIQLDKIGVDSLFIVFLTGIFTGMVMALQALIQLRPFAATSYVGGMVAVTMVKELGPVLSSLMIAGRVGSAITAELGTMVVTEQVDAMRVEGTDVVKRLVTPRLKATVLAMPLLAIITDTVALLGGYIIAAGYDINPVMYWNSLPQFMVFQDLIEGVLKPAFFGFIISMVGCYVGLSTTGGAEGVGAAAKRTVVLASSLVLVSDFFLTKIFIVFRT